MPESSTSLISNDCKKWKITNFILVVFLIILVILMIIYYNKGYRIGYKIEVPVKINRNDIIDNIMSKLIKVIDDEKKSNIERKTNIELTFSMPKLDDLSVDELQYILHFKDNENMFIPILREYGYKKSSKRIRNTY